MPSFNSYSLSIKIPISFLIISIFSFLIAALILSNTSQLIIKEESAKIERYLLHGYAISEYLGVFLFVLSVPLIVNIITTDWYLRIVTFCAAILGIGFYELMGFSLLQSHFQKNHRLFSVLVIIFGTILFISQLYAWHFTLVSFFFILFLLTLTALGPVKKFQ